MEACNFGHEKVVQLLLSYPTIDFEAVNLRGQRADEVAASRGYDNMAQMVRKARSDAENPEEMPRIKQLEQEVRKRSDYVTQPCHIKGMTL